MRHRVRELHGVDKLAAAELVRQWGYPREIHTQDLVLGHWFEFGDLCIFWIAPNGETAAGEAALHVRVRPRSVGLVYFWPWWQAVEVIGDLLGLVGFKVELLEPRLGRILRLLGWTEAEGRWYKSLEG